MKNLQQMGAALQELFNQHYFYKGVRLMSATEASKHNPYAVLGIDFKDSEVGMCYDWFTDEEPTHLEEFIYGNGYEMEWWGPQECYVYKR